jgi:hypothetical protein
VIFFFTQKKTNCGRKKEYIDAKSAILLSVYVSYGSHRASHIAHIEIHRGGAEKKRGKKPTAKTLTADFRG